MFGMIPPPSEKDGKAEHERYQKIVSGESTGIRGDHYYGYERDLKKIVEQNFKQEGIHLEENNIELIEGKFQDTMKINEPIALAHIDCDWYDSVYYCLEQILPNLSPGGVIILDDYYHWESCKNATNDFLAQYSGKYKIVEGERYQIWKPKHD
jgi:asparagine synthase (glutamine-hydrolysing)